jgi:hypothetical protein
VPDASSRLVLWLLNKIYMTLYQIDAFADKLFSGNPAAVIPLEKWIDETLMQNLAMENNLAETVFFAPNGNDFDIRWFTPAAEINLCGHATLASAYVLFNIMNYKKPSITFHSKSGPLIITKEKDVISMDFPSWKPERFNDHPEGLEKILGVKEIVGVYKHRDLLVELNSEDDVKKAEPDFTLIKKTGYKIIITAPGNASGRLQGNKDTRASNQRPDASGTADLSQDSLLRHSEWMKILLQDLPTPNLFLSGAKSLARIKCKPNNFQKEAVI